MKIEYDEYEALKKMEEVLMGSDPGTPEWYELMEVEVMIDKYEEDEARAIDEARNSEKEG